MKVGAPCHGIRCVVSVGEVVVGSLGESRRWGEEGGSRRGWSGLGFVLSVDDRREDMMKKVG